MKCLKYAEEWDFFFSYKIPIGQKLAEHVLSGCVLCRRNQHHGPVTASTPQKGLLASWPLAGIWEHGFQELFLRSLTTWLSVPTQFRQTMCCMLITCFLLEGVELGHARQSVSMRPASSKNPGYWVSNGLPSRWHLTRVVTTHCWGPKRIL